MMFGRARHTSVLVYGCKEAKWMKWAEIRLRQVKSSASDLMGKRQTHSKITFHTSHEWIPIWHPLAWQIITLAAAKFLWVFVITPNYLPRNWMCSNNVPRKNCVWESQRKLLFTSMVNDSVVCALCHQSCHHFLHHFIKRLRRRSKKC